LVSLSNLRVLSLASNKLTALPDDIFQLRKLEVLYLQHNRLEALGEGLGNLTALTELDCERNQLKSLPRSIGNCQALKHINLQNNQLAELPYELGFCHQTLRKVLLKFNMLTAVPGEFAMLNPNIIFELDNNPLKSPFAVWWQTEPAEFFSKLVPYMHAFPPKCVVEGEGITSTGRAGVGSSFTILAKDYRGEMRVSGGDPFIAICSGEGVQDTFVVKDNKNGTYSVFYNIANPGRYQVNITCGPTPIANVPFTLTLQ